MQAKLRLATAVGAIALLLSCGQQQPNNTVRRGESGGGNSTGTTPTATPTTTPTGTLPNRPTAAQLAKSNEFYINNVYPLFKGAPCSNCHNDPRNLADPRVAGPQTILEHNAMFTMLKNGSGANNNKLINKLLNIDSHTGGKVCTDENASPCGKVKEWYKTVFGEGVLSLGKVESINREGYISGYAGSVDSPTTIFEVKFYLDGEKGVGQALPTTKADKDGNDNGLSGSHVFSLQVPADKIDGKPHKIWAYAVKDGQEIMLAGSPFSYTAYKPKGEATATSFAQVGLAGCQGNCHPSPSFGYAVRWSSLLGNGMDGTWTAKSNGLYDKISGKKGHGSGAPTLSCPGPVNCVALESWFNQEFGP